MLLSACSAAACDEHPYIVPPRVTCPVRVNVNCDQLYRLSWSPFVIPRRFHHSAGNVMLRVLGDGCDHANMLLRYSEVSEFTNVIEGRCGIICGSDGSMIANDPCILWY